MNSKELKSTLLEIVSMYFAGAEIVWKEINNTVRKKPYIALKLRTAGRLTHSTKIMQNGVLHAYIQSKSILEVNLFTEGKKKDVGNGMLPIYENTAVSDLEDFCNFICSEEINDICFDKNITILQIGDVTDVTALLDGVDHEYRAMVEFQIDYTQDVTGRYGVSTPMDNDSEVFVPTPSGGRTEEQVNKEIGYFEKVVTESEDI